MMHKIACEYRWSFAWRGKFSQQEEKHLLQNQRIQGFVYGKQLSVILLSILQREEEAERGGITDISNCAYGMGMGWNGNEVLPIVKDCAKKHSDAAATINKF